MTWFVNTDQWRRWLDEVPEVSAIARPLDAFDDHIHRALTRHVVPLWNGAGHEIDEEDGIPAPPVFGARRNWDEPAPSEDVAAISGEFEMPFPTESIAADGAPISGEYEATGESADSSGEYEAPEAVSRADHELADVSRGRASASGEFIVPSEPVASVSGEFAVGTEGSRTDHGHPGPPPRARIVAAGAVVDSPPLLPSATAEGDVFAPTRPVAPSITRTIVGQPPPPLAERLEIGLITGAGPRDAEPLDVSLQMQRPAGHPTTQAEVGVLGAPSSIGPADGSDGAAVHLFIPALTRQRDREAPGLIDAPEPMGDIAADEEPSRDGGGVVFHDDGHAEFRDEDEQESETLDVEGSEELDADDILADEASAPTVGVVRPAADQTRRLPPPVDRKRRKHWYDDVFSEHFGALTRSNVERSAKRDVDFILECTAITPPASVLDVGAGVGHHAFSFAERGFRVVGIDNSLAQLIRASEARVGKPGDVTFLHGDMRELPTEEQFDLVICVGTTFGYFEEDQHPVVLEQLRDRVAPGGKLVLQVFNRDHVVSRLPVRSWWQGEQCLVLDEAEMNYFANRLRVHRTVAFEDGRHFEHYMFIRAFTLHDLGKLMSVCGLRVIEISGSRDTRGRFYGASSPDIWIVAERKTADAS